MAETEELMAIEGADASVGMQKTFDVGALAKPNTKSYCSIKGDSREAKALVFNAANNPQHKVNDFINKTIMVKDVYVETIELPDQETGELEMAPRVVFIDDNGEGYECVSVGMFGALNRLIATFGEPTYEEPIPCIVKQEKVKNGTMFTLDVAI